MIEQVINRRNMHLAFKQVLRNKGSAGVDGMRVRELQGYIKENITRIAQSMLQGNYLPKPILGVSIPKGNGKMRLLGVPTVGDRWLQQSVAQAITPLFEYEFKEHSYGFRPGKTAQHCVQKSMQYISEGYQHIVDIDLQNFFDEVDHCLLLQLLYNKLKCPVTLRLIRRWLRVPIKIWEINQKKKRCATGKSFKSLTIQHHVT
jgi:RNA-directed DNA polymerase